MGRLTGDRHKWAGNLTTTKIAGVKSGNHSNPHVVKIAEGTENRNTYAAGGRCGMAEGGSSRPRLDRPGRKSGGFLSGLKKGALHKEMGVKEGEKIPAKKLEKAAHSDNPLLKKRAVFAENAEHWHHGKKG